MTQLGAVTAPAFKGEVCVHERVSYYTEIGTNHQRQHRTLVICIVHSANVSGRVIKVADAASGSVREVGHCDRIYMALPKGKADAVRELFKGLANAEVEDMDEAKVLLRPFKAAKS